MVQATGWDALGSLENAFVPLTTSLDPGYQEDWLYTGRAFAVNSLMVNAGWMAVVREQMAGAYDLAVPLEVSIGTGRSWAEAGH